MENYKAQHMEVDLCRPITEKNVGLVMGSGDDEANMFSVSVKKDGETVNLDGCKVKGYLIMPNDETLELDGSVIDNKACVTVKEEGYAYDGAFQLAIKIIVGGKGNTVALFSGTIARTFTDVVSDGNKKIYNAVEVLALIDRMEQAVVAVNDSLKSIAPPIVSTANGAIASVTDAAEAVAVQVVSKIVPKADGTAHGSIVLEKNGKNLYPGAVMTNQSSSKDYVDYNFTTPIPPGTYTISLVAVTTDTDGTQCNAGFYTKVNGANKSIGTCLFGRDTRSGATVTFDQPLMMMRLYAGRSSATSAGDKATFTEIMIEAGAVMSDYEPYQGETFTAELPEPVFGGSFNWTTGVLTSAVDANGNELTAPETILIEPEQIMLQKGVNNVWSDTGDTALTYVADTKLYIDQKLAAIAAAALN